MLTKQQVDLLALLKEFKCLKRSQVSAFLQHKHNSEPRHVEAILRQLRTLGHIALTDDYVSLPKRTPDSKVLMAFDIMLDVSKGFPDFVCLGNEPYSLMFSMFGGIMKADSTKNLVKIKDFGIVFAESFLEGVVCRQVNADKRDVTVLFVLEDSQQIDRIEITKKHFFVLESENGHFEYLKSSARPNGK